LSSSDSDTDFDSDERIPLKKLRMTW